MKNIIRTLVVVMALVLALSVFTACDLNPQPTTPPACEHTGGTATCTEAAVCEKCGESYGEKAEHTIVIVDGREVTCTEDGITEGKYCSVCMEVLVVQEEIKAPGHTVVIDEMREPTCTEKGLTEGKHCSTCNEVLVAQKEIKENDHIEVKHDAKAPTCTESGWDAYVTCSKCDYSTYEEKAALGHDEISHEAKAPTCTEIGYDAYVECSRCDYTTYVEKASLGHDMIPDAAVDATCTENGLTAGEHCSRCDYKVAQEVIVATGHKDENNDFVCDVCKADLCTDHIEEVIAGKAPTCTEAGLTEGKKCSRCGEILVEQTVILAKNHSYATIYVWADDNSTCTVKQVCANDASHVVLGDTVTVSKVVLEVTASKVTYTYHAGEQTKTVEADVTLVDSIATINTPAIAGRVASHDYVKFGFHDAAAIYTFTIYYSEIDVWDGTVATEFAGGMGTEEDPFIIMTGAQLAYLANLANEGTAAKNSVYGTDIYYKLGASIDLSGHQWTPIAMYDTAYSWTYFNGHFDGANHKIIVNINTTELGYGLFSGLGAKSVVKNLILCGSVTADNRVGALAYITQAGATVENVTNYANVIGTSTTAGYVGGLFGATQGAIISNCVNYGTIEGNYCFNGGIVGQALSNSKITSCTNFGYIGGNGFQSGGIVGSNKPSQIEKCYNYGTITGRQELGGIAGFSSAEIIGCANYGKVIGSSCISSGLAQITPSDVTKTDCVENGVVSVPAHVFAHTDAKAATCEADGNVAYDYCSVCKKNYDAEGKVIANIVIAATGHAWDEGTTANGQITYACGNCGETRVESSKLTVTVNYLFLDGSVAAAADTLEFVNGEIVTINAKEIAGYVASHDYVKVHVLENRTVTIYYSEVDVWDGVSVSTSLAGSGTAEDPYLIQSAADLAYVAQTVNALDGNKVGFTGVYMRLTKSIDLNGADFRIGVYVSGGRKGFGAYLDGNNCSIRGLNNTDSFIGSLEAAGYVKNLSVYGVVSKDDAYVGGLCSILYNKAIIENVTNYVTVSGRGAVAGIAGKMYAGTTVRNCVNYGTVNAITWQSGGIAGCALGDIDGCVNFGTIYTEGTDVGGIAGYSKDGNSGKGTTSNCYNYGNVTSNGEAGKVGGIAGWGNIVNNCYNYGTVSAPNVTSTYVGGIYGYVNTSSEGCVDYSGYGD